MGKLNLFDSLYCNKESRKVPLSPFVRKPGTGIKLGSVKAHPSWAKFFRRFPDVNAWIEANKSRMAGRLIDYPYDKQITYYSYTRRRKYFGWTFNVPPVHLKGYETYPNFTEWNNAQDKG